MRTLFLIILIILINRPLDSSNDYALILYAEFIDDTGIEAFHKEVHLYKDDHLLKTVSEKKNLLIFDSLTKGNYKIKYKTIYNQFIEMDVLFDDTTRLNIPAKYKIRNLYLDSINHEKINYKSVISQLSNDETYKIKYISYNKEINGSHYSSNLDSLMITKKDRVFQLTHWIIDMPLDSTQLNYFEKFEKELYLISSISNCSNTSKYRIHFRRKVLKYIDNTCEWNGFKKLKKKLFSIDKILNEIRK